jgi:putative aldouronate transport system permease protein
MAVQWLTRAPSAPRAATRQDKGPPLRAVLRQHWPLYAMLVPAFVLLALFSFYPLWGLSAAFVKYNPFKGLAGSEWVGLGNFRKVLTMRQAWPILRNTLGIASGKILGVELGAIVLALMLNEVRPKPYKQLVQTLTTLPHFLSWVIVGGIMTQILTSTGFVNVALGWLGIAPVRFLGDARIFLWTVIASGSWKEFGFEAVIYLAALTGINPDLYEAAAVDGAGRWARLRHVTLPGIRPTIVLLFCLSLGGVLYAGFDQLLVLQNPLVYSTGDILDTFVYRVGLKDANISIATTVGLVQSVVGFGLILLSYWLADRLADYRIF